MAEEVNKQKDHMLSGFFEKCKEMVDPQQNNSSNREESISGQIAKLKLEKIREIIKA